MEKPCTLNPMDKKPWICHWEETISFYKVNTLILISEIGRDKEKIIITRRHYHCEELWKIVSIDDFLCYENCVSFLIETVLMVARARAKAWLRQMGVTKRVPGRSFVFSSHEVSLCQGISNRKVLRASPTNSWWRAKLACLSELSSLTAQAWGVLLANLLLFFLFRPRLVGGVLFYVQGVLFAWRTKWSLFAKPFHVWV
jgi:hypothetical protein